MGCAALLAGAGAASSYSRGGGKSFSSAAAASSLGSGDSEGSLRGRSRMPRVVGTSL